MYTTQEEKKKKQKPARKWEVNLFDRLKRLLFTITEKKKEVNRFLEVSWYGWVCTSQSLVLSNHKLKEKKSKLNRAAITAMCFLFFYLFKVKHWIHLWRKQKVREENQWKSLSLLWYSYLSGIVLSMYTIQVWYIECINGSHSFEFKFVSIQPIPIEINGQ